MLCAESFGDAWAQEAGNDLPGSPLRAPYGRGRAVPRDLEVMYDPGRVRTQSSPRGTARAALLPLDGETRVRLKVLSEPAPCRPRPSWWDHVARPGERAGATRHRRSFQDSRLPSRPFWLAPTPDSM
jgi:hypothetical protein